jgi:hypothetical protein
MKEHHAVRVSRREFMGSVGLTAAAGLLGVPLPESAAESRRKRRRCGSAIARVSARPRSSWPRTCYEAKGSRV